MGLAGISFIAFLPLLIYWANCSGTTKVMHLILKQDQLIYAGYSGSMAARVSFQFVLLSLTSYRVTSRAIWVRGQFIFGASS